MFIQTVLWSLVALVALLAIGVPLSLCFAGALWVMTTFSDISMKGLLMWGSSHILSPVLLCVPLFIFAGNIMCTSGIAKYLLDWVDVFIGRVRGGLGSVTVVTCALIGAISGSGFTGLAATGPILIPRMAEQKYPRSYATALVTASTILGVLIPPSAPMILYGWVTETSILACFLATLVPGLLLAFLFCVVNFLYVRKRPDIQVQDPLSSKEIMSLFASRTKSAVPALAMPFIILGGIYGGVFTPTEAAAVAVIYSIPVGFWVYKGLNMKNFLGLSIDSATTVGSIMVMITMSLILSQTFVVLKVPQAIIECLFSFTSNIYILLVFVNILLIVLGMIVNDATAIIVAGPMLLPLITKLGMSPIQFAAIMGVNLAMGGVTPPYASGLYLGMRIGKVSFLPLLKHVMLFWVFAYIPVLLLTTFCPGLSLWLPKLMGYVH